MKLNPRPSTHLNYYLWVIVSREGVLLGNGADRAVSNKTSRKRGFAALP